MTTWRTVRLKNLCLDSGQYGMNIPSEKYTESGVRLLRTTDISSGTLTPAEDGVFVSGCESDRFALEEGDLLLSRSGTPPGQSYLARREDRGLTFAGYLVRFRPANGVDPRFISYIARSAPFQHKILSESVASTIQNFNAERYANIEFRAPAHSEQVRISNFLDSETSRIDRLTSMRVHQSQLLTDRLVSHLSSVYQQLCEKNGTVRLRHLLVRIEQGWSPQCESRPADEGEWGVIKAGCVNSGSFDPAEHKALPVGTAPRPEYALREGDLLMSRASGSRDLIGSIGIVRGLERKLLLSDKIYRLTLDKMLGAPAFVSHMLRSHAVREHIKMGVSGGEGMANNLPTAVVKDCLLPKVNVTAQATIVKQLDQGVAAEKRSHHALQRSIRLLAERRQALITAAVTGQFDVSTASGRNVTDGV